MLPSKYFHHILACVGALIYKVVQVNQVLTGNCFRGIHIDIGTMCALITPRLFVFCEYFLRNLDSFMLKNPSEGETLLSVRMSISQVGLFMLKDVAISDPGALRLSLDATLNYVQTPSYESLEVGTGPVEIKNICAPDYIKYKKFRSNLSSSVGSTSAKTALEKHSKKYATDYEKFQWMKTLPSSDLDCLYEKWQTEKTLRKTPSAAFVKIGILNICLGFDDLNFSLHFMSQLMKSVREQKKIVCKDRTRSSISTSTSKDIDAVCKDRTRSSISTSSKSSKDMDAIASSSVLQIESSLLKLAIAGTSSAQELLLIQFHVQKLKAYKFSQQFSCVARKASCYAIISSGGQDISSKYCLNNIASKIVSEPTGGTHVLTFGAFACLELARE